MPWPRRGRDQQHLVAHLPIHAGQRHQVGRLDEVDLVDADQRLDPDPLGFDQEAVDQVRLERRLGGAGHDQQLIDVGHQHVLPAFAGAAEDGAAGLDPLDQAVGFAFRPESHQVARCDDVPLVGAEVFQQPPGCAAELAAIVGSHHAGQAMHAEHAAGKGRRQIDLADDGQSVVAFGGIHAHDCPLASQFAFAADPLAFDADHRSYLRGPGRGSNRHVVPAPDALCGSLPEFCVCRPLPSL